MKKILTLFRILIIFQIVLAGKLYAQQSNVEYIQIPDFYSGKGIIFSKDYKISFYIEEASNRFTPNKDQIHRSEEILINGYNYALQNDKRVSSFLVKSKNVKKELKSYYRQYIGYIDSQGNHKIIIHLLNFKCRRKAQKYFDNWKNEYIIGYGEYYEKNTKTFIVSLDENKLDLF